MKLSKRFYLTILFFGVVFWIVTSAEIVSFAQNREGFIVEGESFDGIIIGKSTMDDVISAYGNNFKLLKHKEYSYEMIYKNLGLSFISCQADPNKEIFLIDIQSPSKATTRKGITIGKSNFTDVLRLFGKAERNYEYQGIIFFSDENAYDKKIEESEREKLKAETELINKSNEDSPINFVIDGEESFTIDHWERSEIRSGSLNDSNNLDTEMEESSDETENDIKKENEIINRIRLFENTRIPRQCHVKFRE